MKQTEGAEIDMLPEYNFDYSKAKVNRFTVNKSSITVTLDADIAKVFKDSEAVNRVYHIYSHFPSIKPNGGRDKVI